MTAAIAGYRTAVLALLNDATSIIFTATDVDQAIRWALAEYSLHRPMIRTYAYDVVGTTNFHTMPAAFVTRHVTKVELYNSDPLQVLNLAFYAFYLDEQWVIETKSIIGNAEILTVYYSDVHTIDGLDSAAGTTVPAADETLLQIGAAGRAALMRAMNRIENIGMNPAETETYRKLAAEYSARFAVLLTVDPAPMIGLPDFPPDGKAVF